jgi:formylglycine-generating enzyme required for sulfatase activity
MTLKDLLRQTHQNLLILQEREAKYGGNAPVDLLNEISDHQRAIELIQQTLDTELTEAGLKELKEALGPLLVNTRHVASLNLDELKADKPLQPFEPVTVLIPAGLFIMGSDTDSADEAPQHPVTLPAYHIGVYPVTNAQYAEFIKHEKQYESPQKAGWRLREPPADRLDHPVVGVSWDDAQAYCRWLNQLTGRIYRLPSEAEWEKAARGEDGRRYPWGNDWQAGRCNTGGDETSAVTAYRDGVSPWGCYDLLGNGQEWTSTLWGDDLKESTFPYPYRADDGREDPLASHLYRVYRIYRGGSFRDDPAKLRCSARGWTTHDSKIRWRGFRVVLEI